MLSYKYYNFMKININYKFWFFYKFWLIQLFRLIQLSLVLNRIINIRVGPIENWIELFWNRTELLIRAWLGLVFHFYQIIMLSLIHILFLSNCSHIPYHSGIFTSRFLNVILSSFSSYYCIKTILNIYIFFLNIFSSFYPYQINLDGDERADEWVGWLTLFYATYLPWYNKINSSTSKVVRN